MKSEGAAPRLFEQHFDGSHTSAGRSYPLGSDLRTWSCQDNPNGVLYHFDFTCKNPYEETPH